MALETKLYQKLSQQLVMTPQLRMAIKILQVGRMELEALIVDEMSQNPVLEEVVEASEEQKADATFETSEVPTVDGTVASTTTDGRLACACCVIRDRTRRNGSRARWRRT